MLAMARAVELTWSASFVTLSQRLARAGHVVGVVISCM